jgi:phenylacetate-coenzyme A ligase PaaK-like adenylate-forming protein
MAELRRRVSERLHRACGLTVELTIVAPHTIPRSEGKAVRVVERGVQTR